MRSLLHTAVLGTLALATSALAPAAHADVTTFIDSYKSNVSANTTTDTNAALYLLSGYSDLWTAGSSWDTGSATAAGVAVLAANQAYVVNATSHRSAEQAQYAYLIDRRNQSYSAVDGLGSLATAFRSASGSYTTITGVAADAVNAKYDDKGNGAGLTSSATVGSIVSLVNTLRGSYSSSNPAKAYFSSPRPWRVDDSFAVSQTGTDSKGYYTTTLSDGTPNYSTALTYFPAYQSNVTVLPELLAVRGTTASSDGGFASGHTNAAYLASYALGYAMPNSFQDALLNASSIGDSRIVAGMHLPLDVIGGRMLATALAAGILSDPANATLKANALAQGQAFVAANSNASSTTRFSDYLADTSAQHAADKALYTSRMTYGLPATNATTAAAIVPKGAEVLLETRLSYLSAEQRREVLRTTAIASGNALTDDKEGWGRLNYYAAADGYGAFDKQVTVTMNAAGGGYNAKDAWRNDISGNGGLTLEGSGQLALTGANSYRGDTIVNGGTLVGESATAFGLGNLINHGGTIAINHRDTLTVAGDFSQSAGGILELDVAKGAAYDIFSVLGKSSFAGELSIVFENGYTGTGPLMLISSQDYIGTFSKVSYIGLTGQYASLAYTSNGVVLNVTAVPEPESYAMLLAGLGLIAALRRRKA